MQAHTIILPVLPHGVSWHLTGIRLSKKGDEYFVGTQAFPPSLSNSLLLKCNQKPKATKRLFGRAHIANMGCGWNSKEKEN